MLRLIHSFLLSFLFTISIIGSAFAAEEAKDLPNSPKDVADRSAPIAVEHEGADSLGSELALILKDRINTSSLFTLEQKDMPKFRLLLSTVSEFEDRPNIGSAYSAVWVFSQSEANLRHFISREVGIVNSDNIEEVATKLLERTDGLAVRYSYLFPEQTD